MVIACNNFTANLRLSNEEDANVEPKSKGKKIKKGNNCTPQKKYSNIDRPWPTGPDQQGNLPTSQQPCCTVLVSQVLHRCQKLELDWSSLW